MDKQHAVEDSVPFAQMADDEACTGPSAHGIGVANTASAVSRCNGPSASSNNLLPPVIITCSGHLQVWLGTKLARLHGKALELLAYLATQPAMCASHDALLEAIWPDYDPARADRLLYTTVWKVRSTLDGPQATGKRIRHCGSEMCRERQAWMLSGIRAAYPSVLLTERGHYVLNTGRCRVDITALLEQTAQTEAAIQNGTCEDIAATWLALPQPNPDRLFIGESFEWLSSFREELRKSYEQILARALACAKRAGDARSMLESLHRLLSLEPLREDVVAHVMRLHLARSETAAAARCFRDFLAALRREYGSYGTGAVTDGKEDGQALFSPSHELRALYSRATTRQRTAHGDLRAVGPPPS